MSTLEKVRRLEQYFAADSSSTDPVVDRTIEKLLQREKSRLKMLQTNLNGQITDFENKYNMKSGSFEKRYESGELGDEIDYIEWSSTLDMLKNIEKRLRLLTGSSDR